MGEYWKPVNVDRKQAVHPHTVGNGLKRGEWYYRESCVLRCISELIARGAWLETDEIRAVSDYGGAFHVRGPETERPCDYHDDSIVDVHFDTNGDHDRFSTLEPILYHAYRPELFPGAAP
jgi:hypothetical protein